MRDGLQSRCKQCIALYRTNNIKDYLKKEQDYRDSHREKRREYISTYKRVRRGYYNNLEKNRKTLTEQSRPVWLTEGHLTQIKAIYEHAKDCERVSGEKYHVDHIVPLKGENICGLHVPWNLQVLPADINIAKSNNTDS